MHLEGQRVIMRKTWVMRKLLVMLEVSLFVISNGDDVDFNQFSATPFKPRLRNF
jgi:hypothetical protein